MRGMDALTLLAVIQDLTRALTGANVRGVQPAGAHGLWIEFTTPAGEESLLVSAGDEFPRLSRAAGRPARAATLSALAQVARRVLPGASLQAVTHHGLDRVVSLEFGYPLPAGEAGCLLIAELFGRHPNLILVDRMTGQILEAARHDPAANGRSIEPEQPYRAPLTSARPDPRLLGTVEAIGAVLAPPLAAGLSPGVALRQSLAGLTDAWAKEVVARAPVPHGASELARALLDLIREIETGPWTPHLLLDSAGRPVAASPVRLRHVPEAQQQPYPSLGEMLKRLASHLTQQQDVTRHQTMLRQLLRRLEVRLRSRRAKLAAESLEFGRADLSRRMGEVLMAHQDAVPRGATEVTLQDYAAGPGSTITIPLDPALSPAANAERFFKAARRGRRGAIRVEARLAETEAELGQVHAWAERVADASSLETLETIQKEIEAARRLLAPRDRAMLAVRSAPGRGRSKQAPAGHRPPRKPGRPGRTGETGLEPRRFVSSDGLPILVGRHTQGNDYLTQHLAKSQDLWLHAQGHPGSHVVVRVPNRSNGVPRRTLIQAAQLAAYYSRAREHGKVAVDYTLRKYVRKPRKAKPGLVTISQEKTIIVTPDKSLAQKLAARDG
ncbi:MAG: NFACT family protein [candidate division NC10 bacterium]|nr:NFACT family protein [candidate division NC10 bacterium]